ncbi:hypothetical protein GCM10023315_29450 [Algibacter aquimarinus]|uniref:T9SS type B sorting domain-containing protein n=2 Tax=Algibacter aquimarinus TaxID=1136748 RepID=A0ABP9HRK9_9FLAO
MFSQQITVDNSVPLQQLIEDNLVDGCVEITNITSAVNGTPFGVPSFGYFERASSNFPFQNGILLTTGNATAAGNGVITPPLSDGSSAWGTDPDLETALMTTNTLNATSIEFDITSISSQFQFNYLFASEDYDGINPCQVSDGFVFLIRETGSNAPYQNIALVPGTTDPVNTGTVHTNLLPACAAQNEQYFDNYNIGDTNYIGRTTVLTASTTITPYVSYHVKLIIADQTDGTFDSAVFIEGNSFKILDLGDDISTCASSALLNADIQNPLATYEWFLNGTSVSVQTTPTYNAVQNGTYRVEVTVPLNGMDCVEEDEIVIVLNTEEAITSISNYELCDSNNSGDATEIFDLSTKTAELIPNIPFTNYTFSYHLSETEARGNVNEITTPISNPQNPQEIFVRIEDLDTNCFAYTSFNLIVNSLPNLITPTDLEVCDSDDSPDGYSVIDLSVKDDEITAGDPNLNVTYHYNSTDASNGNNPIPIPYINVNTPTDVVYVRVVNLQTGCVNTSVLNVNITTSPIVNRDTQYIDACDPDLDGTANFDLTQVIADILNGLTGVTVTFHEGFDDAQIGANIIANETNYQNLVPEQQTLYARIEDDVTGCASVVPVEIHTNLLLTGTDTGDFALCDTNDDINDTLDFNLNTVENFISNNLPNPVTVTFFENETDRDTNTNPIDKTQLFAAVSPTVLYIRLNDGNCSQVEDITLLVNPILQFTPATPLPYCDNDDDGITSIDLHSLDDLVTGGNTDFEVRYFPTQFDAENFNINNSTTNELPPFYTNTNPIETLYARIEHILTGCSTVNPFDIEVLVAPAASNPSPYIICDDDQDGFFIVNLEDKISEVVPDTTNLNIDFFTSLDDANTFTNAIPAADLTNYNANTQTIYIRVESSIDTSGCFNIVELEIIVNTLPIIPTIENFQICQVGGSSTADFLLSEKDTEILNGQIDKDVYYFEDAALTLPIDKNNIYQNTSSPQTIYVRVENITDANCFSTSSFIMQVSPDPIYNSPTPFLTCDDISNDEVEVFDFKEKIAEMKNGITNPDDLNISFHISFDDADLSSNSNPLPLTYSNIANPQTIFVRIESDDSLCHVVEEISLNIVPAPDITQVTAPLIECDVDYDGFTTFNLETADFDILDRIQSNLIVNYFENETDINENDGLDNSNAIPDPQNFISNSKTVYIKVANTLTGCFSVIPLQLIVNLPPLTNTIGTIEICDNETDSYDLTQIDTLIVDDISTVNISYHNTFDDANNNTAPIGNTFNYTSNNHMIYIRVSDISSGCPIVVSFELQINPNPIANTPPGLFYCDNNADETDALLFNLTDRDNIILGATQSPSQFSLSYYASNEDAENKTDPLNNSYLGFDGETIFVRVENNTTNCFSLTQFNLNIKRSPIIPINQIVPLCNNDPLIISAETGINGDLYEWSTGETGPEIIVEPSDLTMGTLDLSVKVIRPYITGDCETEHSFTVTESQTAIGDVSAKIDFADPNSITLELANGLIGDYVFILDDDGEPQTSNVFSNVPYGPHIIYVRDLNGCEDLPISVFIFDIPKFFTPNSDSFNDNWHIIGANQLPGSIVYIYNRHGKLLKTLPHTSIGWDGTYNGENMPSDDYWFVAKVIQNGEAFDLKGHFTLKR